MNLSKEKPEACHRLGSGISHSVLLCATMAKRHARVKLSRAQKLERELNHWLAKKDTAIATLCKAMIRLKELDRSYARMQRTAQLPAAAPPPPAEPIEHPRVEAKEQAVADALVEDSPVPPKPKRKRKATAVNGNAEQPTTSENVEPDKLAYADRMRSLGFRPTKR